jgi:putative acetyltransferase
MRFSTTELHIRPFRIGDEESLYQVFYSAIRLVAVRDYTAQQVEAWAPDDPDMRTWAERMQSIRPFVAEIGGEAVAYADLQSSGYIDHFFVSGRHQRQGLGRALMNRIHRQAADVALRGLYADVSRTARPFFEHFGFGFVEDRAPVVRGVVVPNARLWKTLKA